MCRNTFLQLCIWLSSIVSPSCWLSLSYASASLSRSFAQTHRCRKMHSKFTALPKCRPGKVLNVFVKRHILCMCKNGSKNYSFETHRKTAKAQTKPEKEKRQLCFIFFCSWWRSMIVCLHRVTSWKSTDGSKKLQDDTIKYYENHENHAVDTETAKSFSPKWRQTHE